LGILLNYTKTTGINCQFLVFHPANIFLQQIFVVSGIYLLQILLGNNYSNWNFGCLFAISHLPVIFIKWAKLRYWYILLSFLGGTVFSYFITSYSYGPIITFTLHYLAYFIFLSITKSEDQL